MTEDSMANKALKMARKAYGELKLHELRNVNEVHSNYAKPIPDGTDILKLRGGLYYGSNLVNTPKQLKQQDRVMVEIMESYPGSKRQITVWQVDSPYKYTTYHSYYSDTVFWGSTVIGRNLVLAGGITGKLLENIFWHGDHTEVNIQGDLQIADGANLAWLTLGSGSIWAHYRLAGLDFPVVCKKRTTSTYIRGNLTLGESGKVFLNADTNDIASVRFSVSAIVEPQGLYAKSKTPSFYVPDGHKESEFVFDATKEDN